MIEGTSYNPYAYDGHRNIFPKKVLKNFTFPTSKTIQESKLPFNQYCHLLFCNEDVSLDFTVLIVESAPTQVLNSTGGTVIKGRIVDYSNFY